MSVAPIFYATKREALIVLKERLTAEANSIVQRLVEIEREVAGL